MTTTMITPVAHQRSGAQLPAPSLPPRHRWWQAAAVGVAANLVGSLPRTRAADREFYASLPTPAGAPPGWLFAPVWAINNR